MALPRSQQISLEATPFYHCISRCVRRAFLCGYDEKTNRSYDHRRDLIENRLLQLAGIFCIDLCAYAVLSNHYHCILHINQEKALALTQDDIIQRWHQLFKGTEYSQRYAKGEVLKKSEKKVLKKTVKKWRKRLYDISWFMRCSNEPIARQANKEDKCKGKFFESRFASQALLDDAALLSCMTYVDLNPIRAGVAKTPEQSNHTSIQRRIKARQNNEEETALMPFAGNPREPMPEGIPCTQEDYFELVDQTARQQRDGTTGFMSNDVSPILQRLGLSTKQWGTASTSFEAEFSIFVGGASAIETACGVFSKHWVNLQNRCRALLSS